MISALFAFALVFGCRLWKEAWSFAAHTTVSKVRVKITKRKHPIYKTCTRVPLFCFDLGLLPSPLRIPAMFSFRIAGPRRDFSSSPPSGSIILYVQTITDHTIKIKVKRNPDQQDKIPNLTFRIQDFQNAFGTGK